MKTVLVTGGCGFIGSHFVQRLFNSTDWRVVNLDKLTYAGSLERLMDVSEGTRYRFVKADIADGAAVNALFEVESPSAVVNFAAESHVDRSILDASPFLHTNVMGVQVLLDASRCYNVERFVQVSTDEVYGDREGLPPCAEDAPLKPSSPYAASKAAADLLCMAYARTHDMSVLTVRSSNNYGPFQFPEKLIPLMLFNALMGKELPLYGDGLQQRDWLFVEDNVQAIFRVLVQGRTGKIYNIGADETLTNRAMVQTICRILAEETERDLDKFLNQIRFVADRPGHDRCYAINSARIEKELGWRPQVSFEEGLTRTIRWYLDWKDWIDSVTSDEYQQFYQTVYRHAWKKAEEPEA